MVKSRTMAQLAQQAIDVQDACNLSGLAHGFSRVLTDLRACYEEAGVRPGTETINRHPIVRMWVSKLHDLAGMGLSDMDRFGEAYEACKSLVREG